MQKINFENATLTQQAKVTIGDTSYEITPAVYSGGTDLNAETLNYAFQLMHPVGSIYMTTVETNPEDIFGFGTWQLWGAGKVPVCIDANDTDFNTVEKTGGEKEVTLTKAQLPAERLNVLDGTYLNKNGREVAVSGFGTSGTDYPGLSLNTNDSALAGNFVVTEKMGAGQSHNNLQPYITCYMFKRIA